MSYDLLVDGLSDSGMSVLDEDLSFLATQAALELDMLMAGKEIKLDAVTQLSSVMSGSFQAVQSGGQGSSLDPATATIVNRAFTDSELANLETVDELIQKSLELATELGSQIEPNQRKNELANMKKFCIALARCSAAYRETIIGHRSEHPYRK